MALARPSLLVVGGLAREAQIAAGDGVMTLCSGGRPDALRERLASLFPARPREGGDPEEQGQDRVPAFAGTNGGDIRAILSFGLAGGLAPHLRPGDVILASHVTAGDARYDVSLNWLDEITAKLTGAVTLHTGLVAGVDKVLTTSADKAALHAASAALAVDMESHIAGIFAHQHGLPFAVIRAISDPATRSLPPLAIDALSPDGTVAFGKVIGGLVRQPAQLPALIAAGIDSERAFASLRRCRRLLRPLFGLGGTDL